MKKDGEPEAFGFESKDFLRKQSIGKQVKVVFEFSKEFNERSMDFVTIFIQKTDKNLSCLSLEKGLLRTNIFKNGDNASQFLEDLLAAEKKGMDTKSNLFSKNIPPVRVFSDLSQNPKKAKEFDAIISKRNNRRFNGVVEYCHSGNRFKVRLDSENAFINFSLLGV